MLEFFWDCWLPAIYISIWQIILIVSIVLGLSFVGWFIDRQKGWLLLLIVIMISFIVMLLSGCATKQKETYTPGWVYDDFAMRQTELRTQQQQEINLENENESKAFQQEQIVKATKQEVLDELQHKY